MLSDEKRFIARVDGTPGSVPGSAPGSALALTAGVDKEKRKSELGKQGERAGETRRAAR